MRNKIYADGNYLVKEDGVNPPILFPKNQSYYGETRTNFDLKNERSSRRISFPFTESVKWSNDVVTAVDAIGTITATQTSANIVGVGTKFIDQLQTGDLIKIATVDYTVLSVTDDLNLVLTDVYAATTGSGLTASIYNTYYTEASLRTLLRANTGA